VAVLDPGAWKQLTSILFLMVILVPSAIGDYQRQKVPNWLSMPGWVVAPAVAGFFTGFGGVSNSLLGLALMVALLFPLWMVHWFGAADVKLIGTVGAFVGVSDSLLVLLGILVTGMLMSLAMLIYKRRLLVIINFLMLSAFMWKPWNGKGGEPHHAIRNSSGDERIVLPYAIPIAFGTMLTILYLQLH
jgi:prepilin peptidase CpaA